MRKSSNRMGQAAVVAVVLLVMDLPYYGKFEVFAQTGKTNRIEEDGAQPALEPKPDEKGGQVKTDKTTPTVTPTEKSKQEPEKKDEKAASGEANPIGGGVTKPNSGEPAPSGTPATFPYDTNHFLLNQEDKKRLIDRIQWKMTLWTNYNYFNNADLRVLNETNQTSIDNTDDRMMFGLLGAELDTFFPIHPRVDIRLDIWRTGFWGHDQLGGRDTNNDARSNFNGANTVNFGLVYLDTHIFTAPTESRRLDLRVGRQDFRIGGELDRDFIQKDVVDAIVVKWYTKFGKLDLMLIDWYSGQSNTQNLYFAQYVSFDNEKHKGFNGDVNTFRSAALYRYSLIGDIDKLYTTSLGVRGFYYFARYGGVYESNGIINAGADRTNDGTTGNFADNDYVHLFGARVSGAWQEWVRATATYAMSRGKDRKRPNALFLSQDVDDNGLSTGVEAEVSFKNRSFIFLFSKFYAQGGAYYADATQYSHGFTGFKGDQAGGILTQLNWGIYPASYTDDDGIDDLPYDTARKSGTDVLHVGTAIGWRNFMYFKLDWWRLKDTNSITVIGGGAGTMDQNLLIGLVSPTFPTRSTQMAAARRFGAPLGEEINVGLDWFITTTWKFWAVAGVFRPMRYYSVPGLKQFTPEGSTRFTGFQMGTQFSF